MSLLLTALTEAVADGRQPDWGALELSRLDEHDKDLAAELRTVSEIAYCFATLTGERSVTSFDGASPSRSMTAVETLPAVWGPLEIRERVGRGRFGDVYRAWDPAIDRPVALKLLRHPPGRSRADRVVVHEARLMARVRHPNVATIYGAAHNDGRTGLWMEFVEGRTLEAELRDRGPFDVDEAARIGVELCRALGAVHAASLVHRDVKAQNVLREVTGRVVLGDFGTGLELDDGELGATVAGTPAYLAPEVLNRQPATPESDLYSVGVLLFHLVTDSYPVRGRSIAEIRDMHASGRCSRLRDRVPISMKPFAEVVDRALASMPSERFPRAEEMERALASWLARDDAHPISASSPAEDRSRRWWQAGMRLAIGAAAATVGVLITFAVWRNVALDVPPPGAEITINPTAALVQGRKLGRVLAPQDHQFWGRPSPDGRLYTFVDANGDLGVFDTTSGERRILTDLKQTGGFAAESSTFSADGGQVAFAWQTSEGTRELRIIPARGGPPRVVRRDSEQLVHPLDWSEDGQQILVRTDRPDGARALGLVSTTTGNVQPLDPVDASHATATLSPDGRYVVFDNGQGGDATHRHVFIRAVAADGVARTIASAQSDDFGPLWTTDGSRVVFISDKTGEPSVWAVDVENGEPRGEPRMLHRNIGRVTPSGVSREGTLFYTLQVGLVDVSIAALDFGRGQIIEPPRPAAPAQVGSKMNSDWSPDGRLLTYVLLPQAGPGANRNRRLVILDVASGATQTLNPRLNFYTHPRWSPDGRHILVMGTDQQMRSGAYLVDSTTSVTRAVAFGRPEEIGAVSWGGNAHTILLTRGKLGLFSLDLESGRERQLLDYAAEGIIRITPSGFGLSPDGRAIAYSAYRKNAAGADETLLRVKEVGGPTRDLAVGPVGFQTWTSDGAILFIKHDAPLHAQRTTLWSVVPSGGLPQQLDMESHGLRNVAVHADGRRVTFTSGFPGNELWALENFLPER